MDPFDVTNTDAATDAQAAQNGGGSLLDSPSFWRNLQTFGAQTMVAANARTPGGFLQYGSGALGPIGAGILGTMEQNRQNAALQSQLGYQGAQTQNVRQKTAQERIQTAQSLGQYNYLAPFINQPQLDPNGNPIPGSTGVNPLAGGTQQQQSQSQPSGAQGQAASSGGGAGGLAAGVRGIEGGYGTGMNSGGYLGAYQFGTAALTDAGLYKPAPGEDVHANAWKGTISIPGFGDMAPPQFAASPPAQDAAFHITGQRNFSIAQQNGMTNYIGQNVGGVPITPDTLIAGMHFGGVEGTARFLASGGKINPADNNGTTLSNYMLRVANVKQGIQQQQTAAMPQQSMDPEQTFALARQVLTGGIPGGMTPEQAGAVAPVLSRLPLPGAAETSKRLLDYAMAGRQAASVAQAQGANQAPQGYQRMANGQLMPIPGGPGDPAVIAQQSVAKGVTMRPGGMHYDPILGWVKNPELVESIDRTPGPNYGAEQKVWAAPPTPTAGLSLGSPGFGPQQQQGTTAGQPIGDQGLVRMPNGNIGTPNGGGLGTVSDAAPQFAGEGGAPIPTKLSPMGEEFQKRRGEDLAEQFQSIDTHASAAIDGNYLLDNMRRESQSWDMGRFAEWKGDGKAYLQAFAQSLGIATPDLDKSLADYQAFVKSTGQITRAAVHETSSRAAAQEYQMIQSTLPSPEMSAQAFGQIADQMQGVYDYNLAKQKFAHAYTGDPNEMNIEFNKRLTPGAFMVNRMSQTQQGQQDLQVMISNMSKTPQGRARAQQLQNEVGYAQKNGYFDMIDYSGDKQAAAPSPAQPAASAQP